MDITYIIECAQNAQEMMDAVANITTFAAEGTTTIDISNQLGAYIGAGIAMVGASGVGAGQGYAAGCAALAVARNPEMSSKIMSTTIIGMAIAESAAIYALIVSILLLFIAN
ncbi:MAG: ATP synthase F0 subunit C [Mycoplasma sp.]